MWRFSLRAMMLAAGSWADEVFYRARQANGIRLQAKAPSLGDLCARQGEAPLALVLSGGWVSKTPVVGDPLYLNIPPGLPTPAISVT
ncbi:hypothetical protein [Pseudomonas asplenii]|uniref:hypothetical protein n=1 Tax=Pseudomonas asplenii TaxID=53407 RepID=UPI00037D6C16|nr:hypothetical protein [Pseudomonas fuscovaginae]